MSAEVIPLYADWRDALHAHVLGLELMAQVDPLLNGGLVPGEQVFEEIRQDDGTVLLQFPDERLRTAAALALSLRGWNVQKRDVVSLLVRGRA